jgi:hypothetical protein
MSRFVCKLAAAVFAAHGASVVVVVAAAAGAHVALADHFATARAPVAVAAVVVRRHVVASSDCTKQ